MQEIKLNEIVRELKSLPVHAISFNLNWWIKKWFPEYAIVQTENLELSDYGDHGHCSCSLNHSLFSEVVTEWDDDSKSLVTNIETALFDVEWHGHSFTALQAIWQEGYCIKRVTWLIGADMIVLREFVIAVSTWRAPAEPAVEVFQDGRWQQSRSLLAAIKSATFDNLILTKGLAEELRNDLSQFFASQELYQKYGIPWKRGVLISGSPGNGKTHAVKALINWLDKRPLYVKSLKAKYQSEHSTMHDVFSRARQVAPCVLVFEDLETIVTPLNRSYFLNELDGFALNTGIVVIATTNHPELLDQAITQRPSRFDRKYHFELPGLEERTRYLKSWSERVEPDLRLSDHGANSIAGITEGFSFAFLKELVMVSMLRWIALPEKPTMDIVMEGQVAVLRTQMTQGAPPLTDQSVEVDDEDDDDDDDDD